MDHIVLLGDSIFDNAAYVPDGDPVIEQLRSRLDRDSRATLLAQDGAVAQSVEKQISRLPNDCTHLVISAGGNNALESSYLLEGGSRWASALLRDLTVAQQEFASDYREMLRAILAVRKPTVACTIYDAIPGLQPEAVMALSIFNDVIIRANVDVGVPVLDLRSICNESRDYSAVSPIEPSEIGGSKIVRAILRVLKSHDFGRGETVIYR